MKIFSEHSVFVVDSESIYAVHKDKIALRLCGSQNVQCSQEYRFEHNWAIDKSDIWMDDLSSPKNSRTYQIDEMYLRNIDTYRFEIMEMKGNLIQLVRAYPKKNKGKRIRA